MNFVDITDDLEGAIEGVRLAQLAVRGMVGDAGDKAAIASKLEAVLIALEGISDAVEAGPGLETPAAA